MLQQYQRIMVAVDGSSESELAFKKAVNVAQRNNSELVLPVPFKLFLPLMACWLSKRLKWLSKH